jgi:hypothetical protein
MDSSCCNSRLDEHAEFCEEVSAENRLGHCSDNKIQLKQPIEALQLELAEDLATRNDVAALGVLQLHGDRTDQGS